MELEIFEEHGMQAMNHWYRNSYFDGEESHFRGFETVRINKPALANREGAYSMMYYDVGRQDRAFKGKLLRSEQYVNDTLYQWQTSEYAKCDLEGVPTNTSPEITFVCPTTDESYLSEGDPNKLIHTRS